MPTSPALTVIGVSLIHPRVGLGAGVEQRHDWHELIVVERGPYAARVARRCVHVPAQGVVFFPAGCIHRADFAQDTSCRLWIIAWRGWHPSWEPSVVASHLSARLLVAVRWLRERHQQQAPDDLQAHLLAALLHEMQFTEVHAETAEVTGDAIAVARGLLERNLELVWSQAELAQQVGLSVGHLSRAFRARFGMPPMAYLARCRADRANDLLATGQSLAQVAPQVGYQSPGGLLRALQKHTGRG